MESVNCRGDALTRIAHSQFVPCNVPFEFRTALFGAEKQNPLVEHDTSEPRRHRVDIDDIDIKRDRLFEVGKQSKIDFTVSAIVGTNFVELDGKVKITDFRCRRSCPGPEQ